LGIHSLNTVSTASEITRKAKSNLVFALKILPRERQDDMVIFYAFCRTIDDLADDPGVAAEKRLQSLDTWENGILHGFEAPNEFQSEVTSVRDRRQIPNELLVAIIDGCRMDLQPQRFENWADLSSYIWKVSCAVGGCQDPGAERYAVLLGHALQLTNILRDIHEDLSNNQRIYLPLEDLARFQYTEQDLIARVRDERFLGLMDYEAERADGFFREAAANIPSSDRDALLPARMMGEIYAVLLEKMRADRFRVFEKRYRVSQTRKLAILSKHLLTRRDPA
jgi:15-cis-phytoene synthase